jgi:hypothetical protein
VRVRLRMGEGLSLIGELVRLVPPAESLDAITRRSWARCAGTCQKTLGDKAGLALLRVASSIDPPLLSYQRWHRQQHI